MLVFLGGWDVKLQNEEAIKQILNVEYSAVFQNMFN